MKSGDNTFDRKWWVPVLDAWNSSEYRPSLGNLGTVCFEVDEGSCSPVFIHWDTDGFGQIVDPDDDLAPRFKASEQSWNDFVQRRFSAVAVIMLGHIEFNGAVGAILPYTEAFNHLADIAHAVQLRLASRTGHLRQEPLASA